MRRVRKFAKGGDTSMTKADREAREDARNAAKQESKSQRADRGDRVDYGQLRRDARKDLQEQFRMAQDPDYAGRMAYEAAQKPQIEAWWQQNFPEATTSQQRAALRATPGFAEQSGYDFRGYSNPVKQSLRQAGTLSNFEDSVSQAYQAARQGLNTQYQRPPRGVATAPLPTARPVVFPTAQQFAGAPRPAMQPKPNQPLAPAAKPMKRGGKVKTRRFDDGGLASSGSQSAFGQQRSAYPSANGGLGNYAPLVQVNSGDGSTTAAPGTGGPLNYAPAQAAPVQSQPAMKKGGKVKVRMKANCYAKGGAVKKGRGDGCITKGRTKGRMI